MKIIGIILLALSIILLLIGIFLCVDEIKKSNNKISKFFEMLLYDFDELLKISIAIAIIGFMIIIFSEGK